MFGTIQIRMVSIRLNLKLKKTGIMIITAVILSKTQIPSEIEILELRGPEHRERYLNF